MNIKITSILSKTVIFAASEGAIENKKIKVLNFLGSTGIFLASAIINEFLISEKKILQFTNDEELNSIFQQYLFAQAFHAFLSSIFFENEKLLLIGAVSITFTYGVTAIIDKNGIKLFKSNEEV